MGLKGEKDDTGADGPVVPAGPDGKDDFCKPRKCKGE
jgi:hypothetical protein